jgi:hypothetical protein
VVAGGLLFSGLNAKLTGNYQIGTRAFYAAETGMSAAKNQIGGNPTSSIQALSANMGGGLSYRSGHRTDSSAQPLQYVGMIPQAGYSMGVGTGYNASGFVFYQYQMNITGIYKSGTIELGGRELEARATFGPAAN